MSKPTVIAILFAFVGLAMASCSTFLNPGYGFFHSYWPSLAGLCIASFVYIYNQAKYHAELQAKGIWVTHWKWNIQRFVLGAGFICLIHAYHWNLLKQFDLLIFAMCWFGIVFNFTKKHFSNEHPLYVGKNDKKDAFTDWLFSKLGRLGGITLLLVEILGMISSGYVYIIQ